MKDLTGQKIGELVVKEREKGKGNNIKYIVECKCGSLFSVHGFRIKNNSVSCCPGCRKIKRTKTQAKYRARRKVAEVTYSCDETKYTLMNLEKTKIIRSSMGRHIFFDISQARVAARNILGGAYVVPVLMAEELVSNNPPMSAAK